MDTNDPERDGMPTDEGIRQGLHWLIDDAQPGDRLFLHYAGHGDQVETEESSESDGQNEAIVPFTPYNTPEKLIIDNELHTILVKPLPAGCTLIALFDCCHSGTMLDLKHDFPRYRLTRRNLKARWVKDWTRVRRFAHPIRLARSLPAMVRKRNSTPASQAQASPKTPTRKGTFNPLRLPHTVNSLPLTPPPTARSPQSQSTYQSEDTSTTNEVLVLPQAAFVDEPRGNSASSHRSTTESSMQITVSTPHAGMPTPPPTSAVFASMGAELRWIPGEQPVTTTPMSAGFDHEQIAAPPIVRDFQTHPKQRAFSQIKALTFEEQEQTKAAVIAISACLDEEDAIDINNTGGLLTSTFVQCMSEPAHRDGLSLGNMIAYLAECFKSRTKEMHEGHPLGRDGKCDCGLPLIAPKPLVTSSIKLMHDTHIVL